MTNLERMKKKSELLRVQAARAEIEVRIASNLEDNIRLAEHCAKSAEREAELIKELENV